LLNTYINDTSIWEICSDKYPHDTRPESKRQSIIRTLIEGIYIIACFASPIIPDSSKKICTFLNRPVTITIKDLFDDNGETWNVFNNNCTLEKQNTKLYSMIDCTAAEIRKKKHMTTKHKK
jgi:methionyl-tRNA synthetase